MPFDIVQIKSSGRLDMADRSFHDAKSIDNIHRVLCRLLVSFEQFEMYSNVARRYLKLAQSSKKLPGMCRGKEKRFTVLCVRT
jgi:hypothetical protein